MKKNVEKGQIGIVYSGNIISMTVDCIENGGPCLITSPDNIEVFNSKLEAAKFIMDNNLFKERTE